MKEKKVKSLSVATVKFIWIMIGYMDKPFLKGFFFPIDGILTITIKVTETILYPKNIPLKIFNKLYAKQSKFPKNRLKLH